MTDRWCMVCRESSSLEIEISISPKLASQCMPLRGLTNQFSFNISFNSIAKMAPRMHENSPFELKNRKFFWGGGTAPAPDPSLSEEGTPSLYSTPSAPSAPRSSSLRRSSPNLQQKSPPLLVARRFTSLYIRVTNNY